MAKKKTVKSEDFSKENIKKAVFWESLQHPATLYSAALSLLSGLYMGMIDLNKGSLAVALGSGLFSLASFVYNYFFRGDELADSVTGDLLKARIEEKVENAEKIEFGCRRNNFPEGVNAYKELGDAYRRLINYLNKRIKKRDSFSIRKFIRLADDTFFGGIGLIGKALELHILIRQMDQDKLERELQQWESELADDVEESEGERNVLLSKIENHKKRIQLLKEKKVLLNDILDQIEVLEATLDSTYLEVVDLLDEEQTANGEKLANNLERAVESARRVEDRIRGLGSNDNDEIYLRHQQEKN